MSDILTEADEALTDFECEYAHCKMPGLVERLAEDLLEANHRCLDLQYQLDDMDKENRKLREAVIFERAQYIWGHRKCDSEQDAFAVAERELRAEGVIE